MTNTDNTAQSWQDLLDQLTPEQVGRLTAGTHMQPGELLDVARDYARTNLLQATMRDVPLPDAAIDAHPWYFDGEKPSRTVYAGRLPVGNVGAVVVGEQQADGEATWQIEVQHVERTCGDLNAEQARELARVLLEAADQLDRLDGNPYPFDGGPLTRGTMPDDAVADFIRRTVDEAEHSPDEPPRV